MSNLKEWLNPLLPAENRVQIADGEIDRLCAQLKAAEARAERLESALTPRKWTKQQSHVWHCTMPDVDMAFEALRIATLAEGDGKS